MLKLLYYLDLWLVLLLKPWRRQRGPRPVQPTAQLGQHYGGRRERGSPRGCDDKRERSRRNGGKNEEKVHIEAKGRRGGGG